MTTTFEDLLDQLRLLDPDAAAYLESEAPYEDDCSFRQADNIDSCMCWAETRQGHNYWSNLDIKLREMPPAPPDGLTPVQRKCKKLWNNSNWVKAHPHMAY